MQKSTKIVATIGPATESEEVISKLLEAGMNVARFNTKHNEPAWHHERIRRVKAVADNMGLPVGVLLDLQGPEIRSVLPNGVDSFHVKAGEVVTFTCRHDTPEQKAVIVPQAMINALQETNQILIEDGLGEFVVVGKPNEYELTTKVAEDLEIKKRKTINTPGVTLDLPSLVEADYGHLDAATNDLIDFVALSFVRNAQDIKNLKTELANRNLNIKIIAKIENQAAIDNIDEIIDESDGIMVARGDLAVEVPYEEMAHWQKVIIYKSRLRAKPVITATQMLMSMVTSPRPSRAEVTDVANAVYDGTDAVMLSDETTIGKYPIKAVSTQAKIVAYTEKYARPPIIDPHDEDCTTAITHAAISLISASERPSSPLNIDAVVCLTDGGATARFLARFRNCPLIHAFTESKQTFNRLSLVYGVKPYIVDMEDEKIILTEEIEHFIKEHQIAKTGDTVLIVHGTFWKKPGLTNTLKVIKLS